MAKSGTAIEKLKAREEALKNKLAAAKAEIARAESAAKKARRASDNRVKLLIGVIAIDVMKNKRDIASSAAMLSKNDLDFLRKAPLALELREYGFKLPDKQKEKEDA